MTGLLHPAGIDLMDDGRSRRRHTRFTSTSRNETSAAPEAQLPASNENRFPLLNGWYRRPPIIDTHNNAGGTTNATAKSIMAPTPQPIIGPAAAPAQIGGWYCGNGRGCV
ncbi:hypothetical protein G7Y79_00051g087040 [Physcia stellaris]|nr:hypothetical protein G7Y79_00051g087040 [Physcia stellaris]